MKTDIGWVKKSGNASYVNIELDADLLNAQLLTVWDTGDHKSII